MACSCRRQQRSGHQTHVTASECAVTRAPDGDCALCNFSLQVALFLGLVWAMVSGKGLGVRFRGLPNTAGGAFAGELLSEPAGPHCGGHSHTGAATEQRGRVLLPHCLQLATIVPCHVPKRSPYSFCHHRWPVNEMLHECILLC